MIPFLQIGTTLAIFSSEEKNPLEKVRLNILAIWNEISFFNSFNVFAGRILGPTDLLSFNDEIKLMISS